MKLRRVLPLFRLNLLTKHQKYAISDSTDYSANLNENKYSVKKNLISRLKKKYLKI